MSSSQNKQLSIVTVTYNSSQHIVTLLKSLYKEKDLIKEIIIIENDSPDKKVTKININKFIAQNKALKIKFINNKSNDGFAKSCNAGARLSSGKYILFINPDTELTESSLKILLSHADNHGADIMGGMVRKNTHGRHNTVVRNPDFIIGLLEFTNLGKLFGTNYGHDKFYYIDTPRVYDAKNDVNVDAVGGAYILVKNSSFQLLRGFDERFFIYLEDVDLGVRANKMGLKVMYCPHSAILHEGGASIKNKFRIMHKAWYDSRKKYFLKHSNLTINMVIQVLFIIEEYMLKKIRPS